MRLEGMTASASLRGLQQPFCACCDKELLVNRNVLSVVAEHRDWTMKLDDRELRHLYNIHDGAAVLIRAWVRAEHSMAALALCGEITELWEGEYA